EVTRRRRSLQLLIRAGVSPSEARVARGVGSGKSQHRVVVEAARGGRQSALTIPAIGSVVVVVGSVVVVVNVVQLVVELVIHGRNGVTLVSQLREPVQFASPPDVTPATAPPIRSGPPESPLQVSCCQGRLLQHRSRARSPRQSPRAGSARLGHRFRRTEPISFTPTLPTSSSP